ncbi:MAG TPA: hypothetical protein VLI39_03275 [Sedimentisphaerales bacterium]|nr:hypothetical protein [Sedimentisphaerales bacterium]
MRQFGAIVVLLLLPGGAKAAPWSNYELAIGDGYSVLKDMDDAILRDGQRSVLSLRDYPGMYSCIEEYTATAAHIFVQGSRIRVGGRAAQKAFFILAKGSDSVFGPLSREEFELHPVVREAGDLAWIEPQHPHPWQPLVVLFLGPLIDPFLRVAGSPWFYMPLTLLFLIVVLQAALRRPARQLTTGNRNPDEGLLTDVR